MEFWHPQNCHFPLTCCVALTTVYALTCDTVINFFYSEVQQKRNLGVMRINKNRTSGLNNTLGVLGVGPRGRPWPPAPHGDRLWQTLTFFSNANVEPSSYTYTSTELFSDMPTNFGLPPVRCSQWHKKNGYLDRIKRSRCYTLFYK